MLTREEACAYINATPALQSLLYDINRLPECCETSDAELTMLAITLHWRVREIELKRVEEYAVLLRAAATKMRDEFRKEFRSEQSVRERWDGYVDGFDSTEPTDAAYLALDAALATATPSTLSAETAGLATPHTLGVEGTNAQVLTVACPIGLDAHPEICSAGYCDVCKAAMNSSFNTEEKS